MYKKLFLVLVLISSFGCEEVIKVELDDADPQIVIEANISDNPENNIVIITRSTDFYTPSEYESVSNADVFVTDAEGNVFDFTEQNSGTYTNQQLSASR